MVLSLEPLAEHALELTPELGDVVRVSIESLPAPQRRGIVVHVAGLDGGMASGAPSVAIGVRCRDGVVVGETSLALLLTAVDALVARHGDPRKGTDDDA